MRCLNFIKFLLISLVKITSGLSRLKPKTFLFSRTEVDDMMRKFTNVLLTRTLGGCLAGLIRRPNLTLLQVFTLHLKIYCFYAISD
jgi:VanZ family protein